MHLLQIQSWLVAAEHWDYWSQKPKIFTLWPLEKNLTHLCGIIFCCVYVPQFVTEFWLLTVNTSLTVTVCVFGARRVELVGHIVYLSSVLLDTAQQFSGSHPHQQNMRAELLYVLRLGVIRFSVLAILISMWFYLIVALIYMVNGNELGYTPTFSYTYWPFGYFL